MSNDALSALIDGECTGPELDRLLEEMDSSPELKRRWSRMVLAREVRSGTRVGHKQPCICEGVMRGLDEAFEQHPKVVELATRRTAAEGRGAVASGTVARRAGFWKPAIGFAAAASMGAAAVLMVQPQAPVGSSAEMADAGVVPGTGFVSGPVAAGQPVVLDASVNLDADEQYRRMLREYLMDHSHSIAGEGMGSTMGFTRIVAHTADYQQRNTPEDR
jgi:negative regulator of sigma E activity